MKRLPRDRLAACAIASFLNALLWAPLGSLASIVAAPPPSVVVSTQWSLDPPQAESLAQQPEVLKQRLRDSMGSVYLASGLPQDSIVDVGPAEMALKFIPGSTTSGIAVTTAAPATAAPVTAVPAGPPPGGPKATTAASGQPPAGSSSSNNGSSSSDDGGASVVLIFSLVIGVVGLLGVFAWACTRRGRPYQQPKCEPPTIPVRIDRTPAYSPPAPSAQIVYYTPIPTQHDPPAALPTQYAPQALPPQYAQPVLPPLYAPSAPPQYPQPARPAFRVYSRS